MKNQDYPLGVMGKEMFALRALLDSMSRDYANQQDDVSKAMLLDGFTRLKEFPLYLKQKEKVIPIAASHKFSVHTDKDEMISSTILCMCERGLKDPFSLKEEFEDNYSMINNYCVNEIANFLMPLDNLLTKPDDYALEKDFEEIGFFLLREKPSWED